MVGITDLIKLILKLSTIIGTVKLTQLAYYILKTFFYYKTRGSPNLL